MKARRPTYFFIREMDQLCPRDNCVTRRAVVPTTVVIRALILRLLDARC